MKRSFYFLFIVFSMFVLLIGCNKDNQKEKKGESSMEKIEGRWEGAIQIPNLALPIIIQFSTEGGTISIPVQGLENYPLANVKLTDSTLIFGMEIQGQHMTFNGEVENEKISGTFKQQGQSFPFELKKTDEVASEEAGEAVHVNLEDGELKGLLLTPNGEGPFPVMIIIAGSGPTDKDGNSFVLPGKNNSLKMLAEDLAEQGVASIRYDKRGIGQNARLMEKEEDIRFNDYINDAAAWVKLAKGDQRFSSVGIIGHSEGSLIGMSAANDASADAFISIAGAGRPIDQVLLEQLDGQLSANLLQESKDVLEKLKQGEQVKGVSADLQSLFRPSVQPYMISWLQYNPQEQLQKLNCPVLIVNGNRDIQVPVKDAEALHNAKKDSQLLIVEGMNHVLKEAPEDREGNMSAYTNPELPLAKGLIDHIIGFLESNNLLAK
ncbi:alpha/beta hydrolase [Cytobacillus depressus]|uniref:Alpha/beta hydrolase n=1 Tax=Cytobacillus depressus TaxID=1602942 RepID=A0A6L3VAB2_9BACI|nr:alpha/beta hydrolase [Cytobacillus depressus]KAB2336028.1 alpha/beta hydrolase [Cytobacillus depressus]